MSFRKPHKITYLPISVTESKTRNTALVTIILMCLYMTCEAGKGKVPIYMPIPIPIPMPLGPSPGKTAHPVAPVNQHEGEVKKIYLLQPVARDHPQPNLKGGGGSSLVQNHVHLGARPSLTQGQYQQQQQQVDHEIYQSPANPKGINQPQQQQQQYQQQNDLKILPIVVIPPMAPMSPIQLSTPPSVTHGQRQMTLSPMINNYLVPPGNQQLPDQLSKYQEDASFADYGGSQGGLMFRSSYSRAPKRRISSASLGGRSIGYADSRPRPAVRRVPASPARRRSAGQRYRPLASHQVTSIRDIMEGNLQPQASTTQFDDDQPDQEFVSRAEYRQVTDQHSAMQRDGLAADPGARGWTNSYRQDHSRNPDYQPSSSLDYESDYYADRGHLIGNRVHHSGRDTGHRVYHRQAHSNGDQHPFDDGQNDGISQGPAYRPDERDLADPDDEWRFDSIKSMSFLSPNSTISNQSEGSTIGNSTITNTTTNTTTNTVLSAANLQGLNQ